MNKTTMIAVMSLALLAAAAGVRANDEGGKPRPGMGRMQDALGLSAEQQEKMKAAMKAQRDASKATRRKMEDLVEKLGDQLEAKASDKDLQATLDQLKAARKEMQAQHEKMEETMSSILTPTQRAKMAVGMAHRMREHMRGGPGGPGGHGGEMHGDGPHDGPRPQEDGDEHE